MFKRRRNNRKGVSAVQMALMLAFIIVVVIVAVRALGTSTRDELNQTSGEVADPATLVNRWDPDP